MLPVTIYSTPGCAYCRRAKQLLSEMKIEYTEVDLASNPDLRDELIDKYNWHTVPMILIGDEFIGGYDELYTLAQSGNLTNRLTN